jgi:hypothetical protein
MPKRSPPHRASGNAGVRCAIYTRKSSEEGLEQAFNSLDAQREACEAYVLSQKHEGWAALPQMYDDGGVSGGTLDRPALKRLLDDIAAGKIDTVVVYKVDRLTRSLGTSMTDLQLGRLERVDLRHIWTSEAAHFTPWLARADNLAILGETLGIELELEAQERAVGPFRADILCKDMGTDHWVLIENQLERTDHVHLGQLLTYASGLEAVTIVWIAARFTEEHRSTLDWLNKITDDSFSFFGLEVELWRIGSSPAAPKFNIISKPNDWSHSVAQAARAIDESELSETRIMQRNYWAALNEVLGDRGLVVGNKKPQPQSWMAFPIGPSSFYLGAVMIRPKNQLRVELYISGPQAKPMFYLLKEQKDAIERELNVPVAWEELPTKRDCRISVYLHDVDPENEADWPRQHEWLAQRLNEMHRVLARRVSELDADAWRPESE